MLYYGMLVCRTYNVVVERCLTAGSWGVAVAVATDVSEHMLVVKVDICRSCVVLRHCRFLFDPVVDSSLIWIFLIVQV